MNTMNCLLTLIFPKAIEEQIVALMLKQHELVSGFTTSDVEGHGRNTKLQSMGEKVRGRARRVQMKVVLNDGAATALLAYLKQELGNTDIVYWLCPVTEFGSFL
jgi:hypothetical protein